MIIRLRPTALFVAVTMLIAAAGAGASSPPTGEDYEALLERLARAESEIDALKRPPRSVQQAAFTNEGAGEAYGSGGEPVRQPFDYQDAMSAALDPAAQKPKF